MKKEYSAGAIVFREGKGIRYLLIKQSGREHWEFLKGRVKRNESPKETVKRELREEVGIEDPIFLKEFQVTDDFEPEPSIIKQVKVFLTETREPIRISKEHEKFAWVRYKDLGDYIRKPQLLEIFRKAKNFLNEQAGSV